MENKPEVGANSRQVEQKEEALFNEVTATSGRRTEELLRSHPELSQANPIRILERVTGSERGILIFPGGLDRHIDKGSFQIFGEGQELSVFQVRYQSGSGFSLRKEIAETLDHLESRGVEDVDILTGSYGGIPALLTIYNTLKEKTSPNIRSFFGLKAALQPSDLNTLFMKIGKTITRPSLQIKANTPFRQLVARANAPDIEYQDKAVLDEVARVPTLFVIPPKGSDIALKETDYDRFFPNAQIFEDTYPYDTRELWRTALGHDSILLEPEIRELQRQFLDNPNRKITEPPNKFQRLK